jgi:hypothetical protein
MQLNNQSLKTSILTLKGSILLKKDRSKEIARLLTNDLFNLLSLRQISENNDAAINVIAHALSKSNIVTLQISSGSLSEESSRAIADSLPASQITTLDLTNVQLHKGDPDLIIKALPLSKVKTFYLINSELNEESVKIMTSYLANSKLIDFGYTSRLDGDQLGSIYKALSSPGCKIQNVTLDSDKHTEIASNIIRCRQPNTSVENPSGGRSRSSSSSSSASAVFYDCPSL